jgi:hypothetical protein
VLLLVTTSHPSLSEHRGIGGGLHPNLGRLIQPRHTSSIESTALDGIPWAADNDCFQGLDTPAFCRMLDRIAGLPGCRFVTVPDVVGDAAATLHQFDKWYDRVRRTGLPLALVAQDGLTIDETPWHDIAALFIGGTDTFKLGEDAAVLARAAKERGKWVHWGRVNSRRRMELVTDTGAADSCDGSQWARWRKTHLDRGLAVCAELDARMSLFGGEQLAA